MLNFLEIPDQLQKHPIWERKKDQLMKLYETKSKQTLEYYLRKYPQKDKLFIDNALIKDIKTFDYSSDPKFNIMFNMGFEMSYV
jgi:predicted metal-dependent hydrolase